MPNTRMVVTGASTGIGFAISEQFVSTGAHVYAGARRFENLRSDKFHQLQLDLTDAQSVDRFSSEVLADGDVDILVHCAGVGVFKSFSSSTVEDWDEVYSLNARGTFLIFKAFIESLRRTNGQIICITSDVSQRAIDGGAIYASSKYAQRGLLQCLQKEVATSSVRITEICPGLTATGFGGHHHQPDENFLDPRVIADAVKWVAQMPKEVRVDSLLIHPAGQAVEF